MEGAGRLETRGGGREVEIDVGIVGTEIERTGCRIVEIEGNREKSRGRVGRTGIGRERGRGRGINMCCRKDDK